MAEVCVGGVGPSSSTTIEKKLKIPRIMVCSNGHLCNVVKINYALKVEAEVSGWHSNIEFIFPITIGSIPLNFDPVTISLHPTAPSISPYPPNGYPVDSPTAPLLPVPPIPVPMPIPDKDLRRFFFLYCKH